jgi:hypothetical protein
MMLSRLWRFTVAAACICLPDRCLLLEEEQAIAKFRTISEKGPDADIDPK